MRIIPEGASGLNMVKDGNANIKLPNANGKAKENDLREVINNYLENPTKSEFALKMKQDRKEIPNKGFKSQIEESCSTNTKETAKDEILTAHPSKKDLNNGMYSYIEISSNQLQNKEKLLMSGTPLKIANLDVSMEGTKEMIGKDIAAKLNEPRADMIIALVGVIGVEAAVRVFKETQEVEVRGGLMVKTGARRRTPGGTFFHLIRENKDPNINMEKINSVFEMLNNVEKLVSDCGEKRGNDKLDRPCDYFNDTGMCKFESGHFSQSGFTRRIHTCRFCFYRHEVENSHPETQCRLFQSHLNNSFNVFQMVEGRSDKIQNVDAIRQEKASTLDNQLQKYDAKTAAYNNKLQISDETRQIKSSAFENKLQRSDVARQAKTSAFDNNLQRAKASTFGRSDVSRQAKVPAGEKIMTGSNAVPVGIRSSSNNVRKGYGETVEQEKARTAIKTSKSQTGVAFLVKQHVPSGIPVKPVYKLISSPSVCRKEIDRITPDLNKSKNEINENGHQRPQKRVEFKSFGEDKDMKKAKEKLPILSSEQISKSVVKGHQDYQDKKDSKLVEENSCVGKSTLSLKADELDSINNVDCKQESQNGKERRKKGKSCIKCLDKIQAEAKQGEISEQSKEKKREFNGNKEKKTERDNKAEEFNGCREKKAKSQNKADKVNGCKEKKVKIENKTEEFNGYKEKKVTGTYKVGEFNGNKEKKTERDNKAEEFNGYREKKDKSQNKADKVNGYKEKKAKIENKAEEFNGYREKKVTGTYKVGEFNGNKEKKAKSGNQAEEFNGNKEKKAIGVNKAEQFNGNSEKEDKSENKVEELNGYKEKKAIDLNKAEQFNRNSEKEAKSVNKVEKINGNKEKKFMSEDKAQEVKKDNNENKAEENSNCEKNGTEKGLSTKGDKEQMLTDTVTKHTKKQTNKEDKTQEYKVNNQNAKPETKLFISKQLTGDLFLESKSGTQILLNKSVIPPKGNCETFKRFVNPPKGSGKTFNKFVNPPIGNGSRKKTLHCPCPPYCPSCLNIFKMNKKG